MKENILTFFNDVVKEMEKVTWPTREELVDSTRIVVVVSLVIAAFAWIVDWLISRGLSAIL